MSARALDRLRLVRPVPRGARPLLVIAERFAMITALYALFAAGGSAAVVFVCLVPIPSATVVGVLLAVAFAVAPRWLRKDVPRIYFAAARELTPNLLLYAHHKLQLKHRPVSKKPQDYVCEAFEHVLGEGLEGKGPRAVKSMLFTTIDLLIQRDLAKLDQQQ